MVNFAKCYFHPSSLAKLFFIRDDLSKWNIPGLKFATKLHNVEFLFFVFALSDFSTENMSFLAGVNVKIKKKSVIFHFFENYD